MAYSWKYSAVLLGLFVVAFLIVLSGQSWALANATGRIIATGMDLRFLIIFMVALVFSGRLNPLILALAVGAVRSAYFQAALRDHWDRLGITAPNGFDTFWPAFVAALVLFSLWHVASGLIGEWKKRDI